MSRVTKARWANKLMRAKYFVVLTDKESVIALEGLNPEVFDDILALQAQGAALADFHSKLGVLVKDHDKAARQLLQPKRSNNAKPTKAKPTTNRTAKVKKIRVREG